MKYYIPLLLLSLTCWCCEDDEDPFAIQPGNCGEEVIIDISNSFDTLAVVSLIEINEVSGFCLDVTYGGSGCSEEDVIARIYTDGTLGRSRPPTASVTLRLPRSADQAICQAFFTRRDTFDLSPYLEGELPVRLRLADTTLLLE